MIHGIIRELLHELTLDDWDSTVPGNEACYHHKWKLLYDNLESMYPPGELPRAMSECMAFMDKWNEHLKYKAKEGMDYCHGKDKYYSNKFMDYI